jgi:2,4-diaminopentanoate dehydrogenase
MAEPVRVAVWSTGWVGSLAIRSVHRRPDMDLVGVWVHNPDKDGRDVGELVGLGPIGLAATTDADALIERRPDCVVYAASGPERDAAAVPDYVRLLEAGIDVVTVSSAGLVFPPGFHVATRERLAAAAAKGGATLYASGIEPGFAGDHLVLTLATQSDRIRSIRTQELFLYDEYPVAFMMNEVFGFGRPLEHTPLMSLGGAQLGTWGPPVRYVAHGLGVELDEIRETYDRRVTDRTLEVACGVIEAGTCGAIRMETIGVVDGRDAIVIEHVNRMAADLAPDWPSGTRDGTYRVVIDGEPLITCEMTVGTIETASADGMLATAMRVVNAIPHVVDAPPGLVSSLDLPLTLPRNPFAGMGAPVAG